MVESMGYIWPHLLLSMHDTFTNLYYMLVCDIEMLYGDRLGQIDVFLYICVYIYNHGTVNLRPFVRGSQSRGVKPINTKSYWNVILRTIRERYAQSIIYG